MRHLPFEWWIRNHRTPCSVRVDGRGGGCGFEPPATSGSPLARVFCGPWGDDSAPLLAVAGTEMLWNFDAAASICNIKSHSVSDIVLL